MYAHILIATDGSELAQKGLDHGLNLAKGLGSKVTVMSVTEPAPIFASAGMYGPVATAEDIVSYQRAGEEYGAKVLNAAKAQADKLGVNAEVVHVEEMWAAEAINQVAKDRGCDLIVMASHGRRGLGRLILGSQTVEVLTNSQVPVLVVR
ncbi:universal stress protein [Aminobacter sp. AP02]|uniref:universal stress protein n=1 Tax=Aminobacter sp. AP02 TaxID=2135737 RepID=UPI000D6C7AEF|nr:universal stress protein [Aminobacter sp. AP02]PWK64076.1 nucleotide-binding universal stress UspA family protein [Aminobacter sp. AP02]